MATPERISQILPQVDADRRAVSRDHSITREMELDHFIALANEARRDMEDAAKEYRTYAEEEGRLEAERPVKLEELKQLLMTESPSLAATNAERLARCHPEYLQYQAEQRNVVRIKDDYRTRMDSAKLRAKTAIAALKALAGLV